MDANKIAQERYLRVLNDLADHGFWDFNRLLDLHYRNEAITRDRFPRFESCEGVQRFAVGVEADVVELGFSQGQLWLKSIRLNEREGEDRKGRGVGTELLETLCGLCDKHRIEMSLTASPKLGKGWGAEECKRLVGWYQRHGFVVDLDWEPNDSSYEDGIPMRRPVQRRELELSR
ncbi:GNAT family protein [Ferrimonas marina]|uniref:Uncharacterized protein n=1 Tax=Ferrimonas marina TaxID=299255 RepID=A0A1M5TLM4_9GAMM|nr:hypothetical protein [Ferrimonas marina]SHH51614.1 hypothetical protein SAMN02745129_2194 [Ferrimonas marina]